MAYLIGTDEAGYGPNLGPLIVSTSVWKVDESQLDDDLYDSLSPSVSRTSMDAPNVVTIADSKMLYRPGGDLAALERGVLSAISQITRCPTDWQQLWSHLCPKAGEHLSELPWYKDFQCSIPIDLDQAKLGELTGQLNSQLSQAGVELLNVRSTAVFPSTFNRSVEQSGSKGTLLSATTLELVAEQLNQLPPAPTQIICDKHGGRNRYGGLLQTSLAPGLVRVVAEGRQESAYEFGTPQQPIRISFRAGGESFLPSALASMTSKYLREIAMRAFNHFWAERVQDLKPTAGYPVDAKRFKRQIEPTQAKLGIPDHHLWRIR
ncbi:MAG: hypothetical protein GY768_07965 [Planctomycetaceae bacterium]|nr:hypothetical protein [Planctomycetaceae bacterium]